MAHADKPDLVFRRKGRVHLNRRGCQFSRLPAGEECGSADSDCINRVPTYSARLLAIHSIRILPLHFPPCVIVYHQVPNALYISILRLRVRLQAVDFVNGVPKHIRCDDGYSTVCEFCLGADLNRDSRSTFSFCLPVM